MYGVGGSQAISRDTTSFLFSPTFKQPDEELMKSTDVPMNSDLYQQQSSGLTRYRSAPTSLFASVADVGSNGGGGGGGGGIAGGGCDDFSSPRQSLSADSEAMFARFISSSGSGGISEPHDLRFATAVKHETPEQNQYSSSSTSTQMVYHQASLDQHDLAGHSNSMSAHINIEGLYKASNSAGLENPVQGKASNRNCSNLVRQSSSPAGFLSNWTPENGFGLMRDVGNFSRLNDHMNFSSGPSSCSRFMPRIFENGNESVDAISPKNERLGSCNRGDRFFSPGFQNDSWSDSRFSSLKRNRDGDDEKKSSGFSALDGQNGDSRNYTTGLTHHLSLTKTSPEIASIEKFLQFQQDSVPCKIRAKRGCATHPRSIAERMRRTRISERMRKLQELFPNMDKQTNTADMLDLAVEYIKDLQKQVKTLTETRAKCTCLTKQNLVSNPTM